MAASLIPSEYWSQLFHVMDIEHIMMCVDAIKKKYKTEPSKLKKALQELRNVQISQFNYYNGKDGRYNLNVVEFKDAFGNEYEYHIDTDKENVSGKSPIKNDAGTYEYKLIDADGNLHMDCKNDSQLKAYLECFYFHNFRTDGGWNLKSIQTKNSKGKLKVKKNHTAHSKPFGNDWGTCNEKMYTWIQNLSPNGQWDKIPKYTSKNKNNTFDFDSYNVCRVVRYVAKEKTFYEKKCTFYHVNAFNGTWIIDTSLSGKQILQIVKGGSTPSKKNSSTKKKTKNTKDQKYVTNRIYGEYEEDEINDAVYVTDDTDSQIADFPNELLSHQVSKFIQRANKSGLAGSGAQFTTETTGHYGHSYKDANGNVHYAKLGSLGDKTTNFNDFKHLVRSKGIWRDDIHKWSYMYNRMQWSNPDYAIGPTREFLFFTRPDLNLLKRDEDKLNSQLSNDPFWKEMKYRYRDVMQMLQYSNKGKSIEASQENANKMLYDRKVAAQRVSKNEFIPLLTNAVAGTLDLPGSSAETTETGATIYGTTIQYRKGAWKSDEGFDFSLEFIDSPYLQVYHLFKMWEEYTKLKEIGLVSPPGPRNCNPYRINKILHDQIGIFKFIVDDDMETILYYAYLTGCFPKSVPRDSFGNINPGMISYSVDWHAQFVEDMNPLILVHFNNIMKKQIADISDLGENKKDAFILRSLAKINNKYKYVPIYNQQYAQINGGFREHPLIGAVKTPGLPGAYKYVLRWYDK